MKPTEINHPLRTIKLKYNSDKELSEMESTTIKLYIELHDKVDNIIKRHQILFIQLAENEDSLKEALIKAADLESMLMRCGPIAGYTDEEIEQLGIEGGEVDITEIFEFHAEVEPIFTAIFQGAQQQHDTLTEWIKDYEGLDDILDDFRDKHYDPILYDEDSELEIGAFDKDVEEFYGVCGDLDTTLEHVDYMNQHNDYVERYNNFNRKVDSLYRRLDKISDAIDNPPIPPIHLN